MHLLNILCKLTLSYYVLKVLLLADLAKVMFCIPGSLRKCGADLVIPLLLLSYNVMIYA